MSAKKSKPETDDAAKLVAAIDIGSNLLRLVIAEVLPDGRIDFLERLQRAVRLGHDTYTKGKLSTQTMRAAVTILRDYRRLLDFYKVDLTRAVATNAVREASNSDTFLDRILMATGLDIEIIDVSANSIRSPSGHLYHLYNDLVAKDLAQLLKEEKGAAERSNLKKVSKQTWRLEAGTASIESGN